MHETTAQPLDALPDVASLQRRVAELEQTLTLLHARETRYQRLVEGATDLFSCHGPDGAYRYISPACHHLLGYTPDELLGHQPYELFHPDDQAALQDALPPVLDHAQPMTVTARHRRKDGTYVWLETTSRAIGDPATGAVVEVHATSRDVSARKQAEHALAESEARFRQMAENIQEVFWLTDVAKQQMLYVSPAYERIWGRTCDSLYAAPESFVQAIHPADQDRIRACLSQQGQGTYDEEYRVVRPDGTVRWVRDQAFPIVDAHGNVGRVAGVTVDITVRKQQEAALRANEQRLHQFLEALPVGVFVLDASGRPAYTNRSAQALLGKGIDPHVTFDELAEIYQARRRGTDQPYPQEQMPIVRALKGERTTVEDMEIVHPEGRIALQVTASPIRDNDGEITHAIAVFTDITARHQAEVQAHATRDHLHTLLARLDQCVWSLDLPTNTFLYLSPACARIYGVSPLDMHANPLLLRDHVHPDDQGIAAAAEAALVGGEVVSSEYRVIRADGAIRWVVVDVKPVLDAQGQLVQLDGIVTDVTARKVADLERERMQEVLIQLQQAALAELSTPLIPINDEIVVMPLIGTLDTQRARQVLETVLQGVERSRARVVILDITGVPIVDTQVAHTLVQAAQAVKLLGAQVVLTGIRPEVAQTLVTLGVDLRSMVTHSSLQRGIAYATAR